MLEICIQTSYDQNVQLILKSYLPVVLGTTLSFSVYHSGEVYSIQHYVIKFVSGLRQVGGFLRFFPPPIKLTATI